MDDRLNQLESKIKNLIKQQDKLKVANGHLRHHQAVLSRENASLVAKQMKAIQTIETMVEKLKLLEKQL